MECWVAMNKAELQTSLLLLNKTGLPGVIDVSLDTLPAEAVLQDMVKKKFLECGKNGMMWNTFVKTTLWCVVHAQSELRISGVGQVFLRLYFYNETMILLVIEPDNDQYIFYYVPLLPKAIGGLAKNLERLEIALPSSVAIKTQAISILSEERIDSRSTISLLEQAIPDQLHNDIFPITIDGWCLGEHTLESALIGLQEDFWTANKDDHGLLLTSVGFYDFVQYLSRWIVQTHGQSIKKKENGDG